MSERRVTAFVGVLVVAGIALRGWILGSDLGALDSDEAVWGVMARHMLDGEVTAFYWGQGYGGTQETLLTAGLFALVGPSVTALRVVPLALFALAAVLTWRVGIRTVGEPYARLAAGIVWVWPAYVAWKSTRAHGFYGAGLVLGLLVALLALRLSERRDRRDAFALGLALGLGWWATPQVVLLAVPALGWLVWRRRDTLAHMWLIGIAALLSALPWVTANATHDWYSLGFGPGGGTAVDRLHNLAVATLPMALGMRTPFTLDWVGGAAIGATLYVVALAGLTGAVVRGRRRLGPLLVALVFLPVFYALSSYASLQTEPRYLVLLGPAFALLGATAVRASRAATALACVLAALSAVGVASLQRSGAPVARAEGVPVPADIHPLLNVLERADVRYAYADYWIAWRIVFESGERIIAVTSGSNRYERRGNRVIPVHGELGRYPPFYRRVAASADPAYIFLAGGNRERGLRPLLLEAGYVTRRVEGFVVYARRPAAS